MPTGGIWDVVLDCYFERKKKKDWSLEAGSKIDKSIPKCLPNLILKLQGEKTLSFVCQYSNDNVASLSEVLQKAI